MRWRWGNTCWKRPLKQNTSHQNHTILPSERPVSNDKLDVTWRHLEMCDRANTQAVWLSLSQSSFSLQITSQPTFLSVMFGVCISSATLLPSHKYNPPSPWFHNAHTPLCLSRLSSPSPLLSLSVCVSLLSSSYLLSVGPFVCLAEWVCVYLLCPSVCACVS